MTDLDTALWRFPPDVAARLVTEVDPAHDVLTEAETRRMAGFGHASRRRQFALGRVAARTLAAERLGVSPVDVPLRVGADGAPEVGRLGVSIAHTGRAGAVAALAAVAAQPVGVDLERVAPRRPDLWTRILNPSEHDLLDALGGPTDDVQTLLWTLKESVLKGQRTGFRAGGRSIHLATEADGEAPEHGLATAMSGDATWRIAFGRVGDLWAAVAWRLTPPESA